jgi:hypothetical protein
LADERKIEMRKNGLFVVAVLLTAPISLNAEECSPGHLIKIVVENQSPAIPKGQFASLPKTIYRYRSNFARIEEANDAANNIHGLIVVNEPDSWIANLATHDGRHAVDQQKPFVVHMPVFAGRAKDKSFPRELLALEFGCEAAFFDRWKSPEEPLRGDSAGRLRRAFGVGDWMVVTVREKNASVPSVLFLLRGDDIVDVLHYSSYEILPPDMKLFEKPSGISFQEPKPN